MTLFETLLYRQLSGYNRFELGTIRVSSGKELTTLILVVFEFSDLHFKTRYVSGSSLAKIVPRHYG